MGVQLIHCVGQERLSGPKPLWPTSTAQPCSREIPSWWCQPPCGFGPLKSTLTSQEQSLFLHPYCPEPLLWKRGCLFVLIFQRRCAGEVRGVQGLPCQGVVYPHPWTRLGTAAPHGSARQARPFWGPCQGPQQPRVQVSVARHKWMPRTINDLWAKESQRPKGSWDREVSWSSCRSVSSHNQFQKCFWWAADNWFGHSGLQQSSRYQTGKL